jgi:hypothetical protein
MSGCKTSCRAKILRQTLAPVNRIVTQKALWRPQLGWIDRGDARR